MQNNDKKCYRKLVLLEEGAEVLVVARIDDGLEVSKKLLARHYYYTLALIAIFVYENSDSIITQVHTRHWRFRCSNVL